MDIRYLTYSQVDKQKWDDSISHAGNGLIYGYSFYLDAMAKHWDALVLNDYEAVMPLTWNKKYGVHYLYQPPFTAQAGIFGNDLDASLINDFLLAVPPTFKYWDITLNHGNHSQVKDFNLFERVNYVLPLDEGYETLFKNFRENIQRNTRKSRQLGCTVVKDIGIGEVVALAKTQTAAFSALSEQDFSNMANLYQLLRQQGKAITYGVYQQNDLLASAAFFFSHNRAYYILVGNHPNGKTIGASHALIDAFIKDNAGSGLLLDFEGSDIHSLAFFYSSFGAQPEKYTAIKLNRLPFFMKWLKR